MVPQTVPQTVPRTVPRTVPQTVPQTVPRTGCLDRLPNGIANTGSPTGLPNWVANVGCPADGLPSRRVTWRFGAALGVAVALSRPTWLPQPAPAPTGPSQFGN